MSTATLITAHSGADGFEDNSMDYVRRALGSEADIFEIDVRRGADGELRLGHDEADGRLPLLGEVFELAAAVPGKRVNCDLKERGLDEEVCALAAERGMAGRIILTGSADAEKWSSSAALRETAELWLNIEEYVPDVYGRFPEPGFPREAAERVAAVCRSFGVTTVNMHWRLAVPELRDVLVSAGLGLSVWTVNEPEEIERFLREGTRSVTTRALAEALEIRKRLR